MKHLKTLLLAFVLLPLLVGTASAKEVELRVIRIGSGDGFVMGEDICCGDDCKRNYEEGTIVHLKADPYPDSKFVGWLINDQPHEGVITIDQDTIVKAIFELKTGLDLSIYWYSGDTKKRAKMVLDEVAVFIEPWEKWEVTTQEEFTAAAQEIAQRFHPQAVVSEQYEDYLLLVKSPVPVEKEQLSDILFSLKELKYVRQASPVFYRDPGDSGSQLILTDQIHIKFPDKYTDDQIATIEAEYGLVRIKSLSFVLNGFRYRVSDPLEALDVANRLYESGQVDYSYPGWIKEYRLNSRPNDTYFGDQWYLENTGQYGGVKCQHSLRMEHHNMES
jgi:hypothetical protein